VKCSAENEKIQKSIEGRVSKWRRINWYLTERRSFGRH